jgi:hypothetical protein
MTGKGKQGEKRGRGSRGGKNRSFFRSFIAYLQVNPVQVETYSFFYSKTQVFKMDRVYI